VPVAERSGYAAAVADVLIALHRPAASDAPANPFRGVPLADRATTVAHDWEALADAHGDVVVGPLVEAWRRGVAAPPWPGRPLWLHGDPHPLNLLADRGRLSGLLDFGDVTAGDPASDLATAWLTFDAAGRATLVERVMAAGAVDPAVWDRAAAWAAAIAGSLLRHHVAGEALHEVAIHAAAQLADR